MKISSLSLSDFRNFSRIDLALGERFNVFAGANAQGKTNLLEAVYLLGALRPLRSTPFDGLIRWGAERALLRAEVVIEGIERSLEVELCPGRREARASGKTVRSPAEFLKRTFAVCCFVPDDLGLVKGAPAARRRYLDRAIFGADPAYLDELRRFKRALERRNALLRSERRARLDLRVLEAFDEEFAAAAARVLRKRLGYVERLGPLAADVHRQLVAAEAAPALRYTATVVAPRAADAGPADGAALAGESETALAACVARALAESQAVDRRRGTTSAGPQRDDLEIALGGHGARETASQGQQRTVVVALKIAEILIARAARGSNPVLLLDDVASELDAERSALLFRFLEGHEGQVLITTTDRDRLCLGEAAAARSFSVEQGTVR